MARHPAKASDYPGRQRDSHTDAERHNLAAAHLRHLAGARPRSHRTDPGQPGIHPAAAAQPDPSRTGSGPRLPVRMNRPAPASGRTTPAETDSPHRRRAAPARPEDSAAPGPLRIWSSALNRARRRQAAPVPDSVVAEHCSPVRVPPVQPEPVRVPPVPAHHPPPGTRAAYPEERTTAYPQRIPAKPPPRSAAGTDPPTRRTAEPQEPEPRTAAYAERA